MLAAIDIVKSLEPNWTHLRGVSPHILPPQAPDCEPWTFQKRRMILEAHQDTGVCNDVLFFRLWATDAGLTEGMDEKVVPLRLALLSVAAHWLNQLPRDQTAQPAIRERGLARIFHLLDNHQAYFASEQVFDQASNLIHTMVRGYFALFKGNLPADRCMKAVFATFQV